MITLQDVMKTYKKANGTEVEVLRGISLQIDTGEYLALMAPSGMGKTTLMNIIGCLDKPTGGHYFLDGVDIAKASDDELSRIRNKKIGFVFQSFNLLARTSALENVELPLIYSANPGNTKEKAAKALEAVGLGSRLDHTPAELSGGQQQRVAIARALVNEPDIIFADEPTGNLDSKSSDEVMGIFRELNKNGKTIVLVTHEAEIASETNRVVKLKDGKIVGDDSRRKQ